MGQAEDRRRAPALDSQRVETRRQQERFPSVTPGISGNVSCRLDAMFERCPGSMRQVFPTAAKAPVWPCRHGNMDLGFQEAASLRRVSGSALLRRARAGVGVTP